MKAAERWTSIMSMRDEQGTTQASSTCRHVDNERHMLVLYVPIACACETALGIATIGNNRKEAYATCDYTRAARIGGDALSEAESSCDMLSYVSFMITRRNRGDLSEAELSSSGHT